MIGRRVTGFAYPFGDYNDASVQAVGEVGLDYAVTTNEREISPQTNPFRIPRILVADWDEADFRERCFAMAKPRVPRVTTIIVVWNG